MKADASFFVIIDYTDEAKELNVSGESNMVIKYVMNGIIIKQEPFMWGTIKRLEEQNIPVVWENYPHEKPKEPKIRTILDLR